MSKIKQPNTLKKIHSDLRRLSVSCASLKYCYLLAGLVLFSNDYSVWDTQQWYMPTYSIMNAFILYVSSAPCIQPDWYSLAALARSSCRVRKQGLYELLERHPTQLKHHMDPCLPIMSLHWTDRSLSLQKGLMNTLFFSAISTKRWLCLGTASSSILWMLAT